MHTEWRTDRCAGACKARYHVITASLPRCSTKVHMHDSHTSGAVTSRRAADIGPRCWAREARARVPAADGRLHCCSDTRMHFLLRGGCQLETAPVATAQAIVCAKTMGCMWRGGLEQGWTSDQTGPLSRGTLLFTTLQGLQMRAAADHRDVDVAWQSCMRVLSRDLRPLAGLVHVPEPYAEGPIHGHRYPRDLDIPEPP